MVAAANDPKSPLRGDDPAAQMRDHWQRFAREDAMFYVATSRREWDPSDFYAQGGELVESVLAWAGDLDRGQMLEVGCGAGRMLAHFAPHFDLVYGIDIAPEMIAAARKANLPANIELATSSGTDLRFFADDSFGFAFSLLVFQHIPDRDVVAGYLAEIARVLRPAAKAVLHFDTRPDPALRRLALSMPDRLLPRTRRRFIRRYPVSQGWLSARLAGAGLEVLDERSPGTEDHFMLCRTAAG